MAAPPSLPTAPSTYDRAYQDGLNRVLTQFFNHLVNATAFVIAQATVRTTTETAVTVMLTDGLLLIDTSAGATTAVLPAASATLGLLFTVKRITAGANSLTVSAATGNIDGSATLSIATQYTVYSFRSDGTNYWIV